MITTFRLSAYRSVFRVVAAAALLAPLGLWADNLDPGPDTIYRNARIYTVDAQRRWAQAMAVQGDTVLAIGTNPAIDLLAETGTRVIDLGGRMVMPGIHDAHTHLLVAGLKWTHECRLPPNAGPTAIVEALRVCADASPGNGWIIAGEVNPNVFGEAPVDKAFLDQEFPERPVYLYDFSIHHALVNSQALAAAGIDSDTPNPHKGEIKRDAKTGAATGELVEMATVLVTRVIPSYSDDVYENALRFAIKRCHEFGITSIQEASGTRRLLQLYRDFDRADELQLNVTAHLVWGSEKWGDASPGELDELFNDRSKYASNHVDVNASKVWMDGAPLPPYFSEARIDPARDAPDEQNLLISTDILAAKLREWRAENVKAKIHVAGAGAARAALDAIEQVYGKAGVTSDPRPDLAHSDIIAAPDIRRYAELGVIAEMSPAIWHLGTIEGFEMVNDWWPFASLHKAGARITIGSDWILTPDPNLFPALAGAVTRRKESVGLAEAIDMLTLNGAAAVGAAKRFGSLEVGKAATFIVLDRNLFEGSPTSISETQVLMTVFEGEPVYRHAQAPAAWATTK